MTQFYSTSHCWIFLAFPVGSESRGTATVLQADVKSIPLHLRLCFKTHGPGVMIYKTQENKNIHSTNLQIRIVCLSLGMRAKILRIYENGLFVKVMCSPAVGLWLLISRNHPTCGTSFHVGLFITGLVLDTMCQPISFNVITPKRPCITKCALLNLVAPKFTAE